MFLLEKMNSMIWKLDKSMPMSSLVFTRKTGFQCNNRPVFYLKLELQLVYWFSVQQCRIELVMYTFSRYEQFKWFLNLNILEVHHLRTNMKSWLPMRTWVQLHYNGVEITTDFINIFVDFSFAEEVFGCFTIFCVQGLLLVTFTTFLLSFFDIWVARLQFLHWQLSERIRIG